MSFQPSGQTGPFLALLKISAILLKDPTFDDVFFSCFHREKSTKLKFLQILASALKRLIYTTIGIDECSLGLGIVK